jgi:hypothetical protein
MNRDTRTLLIEGYQPRSAAGSRADSGRNALTQGASGRDTSYGASRAPTTLPKTTSAVHIPKKQ